jgi:hypothetical protein
MGHGNPITVTIMPVTSIASTHAPAASPRQSGQYRGFRRRPVAPPRFMGAAIDHTRANSARCRCRPPRLTALMLAKDLSDGKITPDQIMRRLRPILPRSAPIKTHRTINATYSPARVKGRPSRSTIRRCDHRTRRSPASDHRFQLQFDFRNVRMSRRAHVTGSWPDGDGR